MIVVPITQWGDSFHWNKQTALKCFWEAEENSSAWSTNVCSLTTQWCVHFVCNNDIAKRGDIKIHCPRDRTHCLFFTVCIWNFQILTFCECALEHLLASQGNEWWAAMQLNCAVGMVRQGQRPVNATWVDLDDLAQKSWLHVMHLHLHITISILVWLSQSAKAQNVCQFCLSLETHLARCFQVQQTSAHSLRTDWWWNMMHTNNCHLPCCNPECFWTISQNRKCWWCNAKRETICPFLVATTFVGHHTDAR